MTPIQEASKEWFEMEGGPTKTDLLGGAYFIADDGKHYPVIDANYFFSEVVGRIYELLSARYGEWIQFKFSYIHPNHIDYIFCSIVFQNPLGGEIILIEDIKGKSPEEAGLKAAIAARKELGV